MGRGHAYFRDDRKRQPDRRGVYFAMFPNPCRRTNKNR